MAVIGAESARQVTEEAATGKAKDKGRVGDTGKGTVGAATAAEAKGKVKAKVGGAVGLLG